MLDVIFRVAGGTPVVTAVFPSLPGTYDPDTALCYAHVGQHGACSRAWYRTARAATETEYMPLLRELTRLYGRSDGPGNPAVRLRVVGRWMKRHDTERCAILKRAAK